MNAPGISRRRQGRGISYRMPSGELVTDPAILERVRSLAVPPAWRDVWICPWPNGHIQATGIDAAGRKQYRYHDRWREDRDAAKHERVLRLAPRLIEVRAVVAEDLVASGLPRERVVAAALRMLERGGLRTGNETYREDNGTYGVSTLLREHVRVRSSAVICQFVAKGGAQRSVRIPDPMLAMAIRSLRGRRQPGDELFAYRSGRARWRQLRAEDVNERFKELAGDEFTAKDLRTWNATVLAAAALAGQEPPRGKRATARAVLAALRTVAEHLGNTVSVARGSYVDPHVIELYQRGVTIAPALAHRGDAEPGPEADRAEVEAAVLRMLREHRADRDP